MTTIVDTPQTGEAFLSLEAALATRVIRSATFPLELFQWLIAPDESSACATPLTDPKLTASMSEILTPLLADARRREQSEARHAAVWLGAICRSTASHYDRLNLGIGPRMLAAALLPLYRSLATGQLSEGLRESRLRLSEVLTLLLICDELGSDLGQLLDPLNRQLEAPNLILSTQFDLDLVFVAQIIREQLASFDPNKRQFNAHGVGALKRLDRRQVRPKTVDWSAPELLWKLAGELISQNSELVLPRAWIETPVPWNSIADHWSKLSLLLTGSAPTVDPNCRDSDEAKALAAVNELTSMLNPQSLSKKPSSVAVPPPIDLGTASEVHASDALPHNEPSPVQSTFAKNTAAMIAAEEPASDKPSALAVKSPDKQTSGTAAPVVIPKVLIAEIRTHNDPVFVKVLCRQIAKCRSEDRAISLVSMIVLPEDGNNHHDVRENGLTLWQQRLVNWLADHPQVVEPHAFLTSEGELLLCLLDLERNEMTTLVRHGLVEVLTGRPVDDCDGNMLARVNVPARYHAGIASTSAPGAGFTAEQLIEPAVRCLSAASRHGKASIKSIEVF